MNSLMLWHCHNPSLLPNRKPQSRRYQKLKITRVTQCWFRSPSCSCWAAADKASFQKGKQQPRKQAGKTEKARGKQFLIAQGYFVLPGSVNTPHNSSDNSIQAYISLRYTVISQLQRQTFALSLTDLCED